MKFNVIVADPPWGDWNDKLSMSDVSRGADSNYNTMSIDNIKSLKIKDLSSENGTILALWVPSSLLQNGLDVIKSWGFTHKQTYVWVKTKKQPFDFLKKWLKKTPIENNIKNDFYDKISNTKFTDLLSFGMGRLFRQSHEICLIAINNTGIYKHLKNRSQRSVSFNLNLKHSQKPEDLQNSLDDMFDSNLNKLEIFSRRQRKNWFCIGNEAPMSFKEDILTSINKLLKINNEDINLIKGNFLDKDKYVDLNKIWKDIKYV